MSSIAAGEFAENEVRVVDKGTPELQEAMDRGGLAVSTAAKVAELPLHPTTGACPQSAGNPQSPWVS